MEHVSRETVKIWGQTCDFVYKGQNLKVTGLWSFIQNMALNIAFLENFLSITFHVKRISHGTLSTKYG